MKTILVIENDSTLRENICDFLKAEGYNVLSADDGLTGLQQAMSNLPDLILCDIMMPGMNGYDFYITLQQIKSTSVIPLIFAAAQSEIEDFRAGMNQGVDDYIAKPFNYKELIASIKTRLDKRERIQLENDKSFYSLVDNPLTGVFIYGKSKFDFVNEKCAKIFGLTPTDFSNMTFDNLIIGNNKDKDNVLDEIEHCFSKAQNSLHIHFQAIHHTGEHEIAVEMYASIVNFKGVDSLVGYMFESAGANKVLQFSEEKDKSEEILSKKELKIIEMVCNDFSSAEIAIALGRSTHTIETYRANILNDSNGGIQQNM
jgi:CheY-like chemotaxis protein